MFRVYSSFFILFLSFWAAKGFTDAPFVEGKHYQCLVNERISNTELQRFLSEHPNAIQVVEFFNYGCAACKWLYPEMTAWYDKKPDFVKVLRVPLVFNQKWETLAKAYFVVEELQQHQNLDPKIFEAIHDQKKDLSDKEVLKQFFVEQGISENFFLDLFDSFEINNQLMKAKALANAYQVALSPVFIVNGSQGSYWITPKTVKNQAELVSIIDDLVTREAKNRAGV
jgi:thiol:disulfide interchange protein DsbA